MASGSSRGSGSTRSWTTAVRLQSRPLFSSSQPTDRYSTTDARVHTNKQTKPLQTRKETKTRKTLPCCGTSNGASANPSASESVPRAMSYPPWATPTFTSVHVPAIRSGWVDSFIGQASCVHPPTHHLHSSTPIESLVVAATDAEDDYFSYEQAARYGYAEEGGKFREKPHKVYITALARRAFRSSRVLVHPSD